MIWTKESGPKAWSKQVFEDLGHDDLVRTYLGWYVGSAPDASDLVLDNSIVSTPDGPDTMTDTHVFEGPAGPRETEGGQHIIYLREQLAGEARLRGTLYVYPSPR